MTRENEAFDKAFPVILARDKVIEAAKAWTTCCRAGRVEESIPLANALADAVEALLAAEKDRT
jgi:hypothetical protein